MTKNKDYSFNFPELELPKIELPMFEQFEVQELMFNLDGLLDFSFNDFVS